MGCNCITQNNKPTQANSGYQTIEKSQAPTKLQRKMLTNYYASNLKKSNTHNSAQSKPANEKIVQLKQLIDGDSSSSSDISIQDESECSARE